MMGNTDGLASAYQLTQYTGGGEPILETGGNLLFGVVTFPQIETIPLVPFTPETAAKEKEKELSGNNESSKKMSENKLFQQLTESGLKDLSQGRVNKIKKEKT
jgi:hypothetical protein